MEMYIYNNLYFQINFMQRAGNSALVASRYVHIGIRTKDILNKTVAITAIPSRSALMSRNTVVT